MKYGQYSKAIYMIMFNRTFAKGAQYRVLKKLWSIVIIIISIWEVLLPAEHLHTCHLILTTLSPGNQNLLEEAEAQQCGTFPKSCHCQGRASGFLNGC